MSMTIDECFAKLDGLGNDKDQSEQIFTQLKPKIDDYELIDETMFFLYSARFFQAKAKFLRSLSNVQNVIKQEKLADLYQRNMNNERRFYHHKNQCLYNQHMKIATWEKPSRFVIVLLTS